MCFFGENFPRAEVTMISTPVRDRYWLIELRSYALALFATR